MSKKVIRENYRVEVSPIDLGDFGVFRIRGGAERTEEQAKSACEDIAQQIRRHVEGLGTHGNKGVNVLCDALPVCEHCGAKWTEGDDTYNGGCCKKDQEHECDEDHEPDVDICASCKEHASFCSKCNESNCCGAGEMSA